MNDRSLSHQTLTTPVFGPDDGPALTTTPRTFRQFYLNTAAVWTIAMVLWAVMDVLVAVVPAGGRRLSPQPVWYHLLVPLLGYGVIWFMHRTNFPAAWDTRVPLSKRVGLPILVGAGFGVLAILVDKITGSTAFIAQKFGTAINVDFPRSLFVYTGGPFYLEFEYRLLWIPFLLWLVSSVILKGRHQDHTFWGLAGLTSLIEPCIQGIPLFILADGAITPSGFALYFAHAFAFNLTCAYFLRRHGLLGGMLTRYGNYLVWHIAWGAYLQYLA